MNHRYILERSWMGDGRVVNWIMLNPSTADEIFDDPTIRKCCGFSKRWGYSGILVTNLFAFRATNPKDMKECARLSYRLAVGDDNDGVIIKSASVANLVVAAWGTHGRIYRRDEDLMNQLLPETTLHCIGLTKEGCPTHPCMAPYTDAPKLFREVSI